MRESEYLPHTALVYSDTAQRNRLIESYVGGPKLRWGALTVLSAQADSDTRYFGRGIRAKRKLRDLPLPNMVDVDDLLQREVNPAKTVASVLHEACLTKKAESPPLVIGDWAHAAYDRFKAVLSVERGKKRTTNLVCCYRGEGFWSLPPHQIAQVCELHGRVIFGPMIFEMK